MTLKYSFLPLISAEMWREAIGFVGVELRYEQFNN